MRTPLDYILVDHINGYEFGLVLHLSEKLKPVEIIVIHHDSYCVRTLDYTSSVASGLQIAKLKIETGFEIAGVKFKGIQGYHLPLADFPDITCSNF